MKLYTKTVCPKCIWIKSEAQRAGREVEVMNIDRDEAARERLVLAGISSVPALEADGRFILDPAEMAALMKRTEPMPS